MVAVPCCAMAAGDIHPARLKSRKGAARNQSLFEYLLIALPITVSLKNIKKKRSIRISTTVASSSL
jgi:hypothetical protein